MRRIYRIRKSLKFTQGKKQYAKRLVTPAEASKNNKYLLVQVFKCEANWASGMQMRQIVSGQKAASNKLNQDAAL